MNPFRMSVLSLGLATLGACATMGPSAPGVTRTTSAPAVQCRDERAACVSSEDCCNANCFYGVCERPEQE